MSGTDSSQQATDCEAGHLQRSGNVYKHTVVPHKVDIAWQCSQRRVGCTSAAMGEESAGNKDACHSRLEPKWKTKYLRDAWMSIYVTGRPGQYMSNKDTQEYNPLDP